MLGECTKSMNPQRVTSLDMRGVIDIVASSGHVVVATQDGKVYVSGQNVDGQLGLDAEQEIFSLPTELRAINENIKQVAVGKLKPFNFVECFCL